MEEQERNRRWLERNMLNEDALRPAKGCITGATIMILVIAIVVMIRLLVG